MPYHFKEVFVNSEMIGLSPHPCGHNFTYYACQFYCTQAPSRIDPCHLTCTNVGSQHVPEDWTIFVNPGAAKQRLRIALAAAEAAEKAQAEVERPQTLEAAEAIERQLTEALEDVRRTKAGLQGATKGPK